MRLLTRLGKGLTTKLGDINFPNPLTQRTVQPMLAPRPSQPKFPSYALVSLWDDAQSFVVAVRKPLLDLMLFGDFLKTLELFFGREFWLFLFWHFQTFLNSLIFTRSSLESQGISVAFMGLRK